MGTVSQEKVLVNDTVERLRLLNIEGEPATNPANGNECAWIDAQFRDVAEQAGLTTWDAAGYMVLHLSSVLRKNGAEFVGIQETMNMLEQLEQAFPALVKETVPKVVSPFQLTDILRRLIEEEISIRDLRSILQALAEWGQVEHDTVMLTENVREALKRLATSTRAVRTRSSSTCSTRRSKRPCAPRFSTRAAGRTSRSNPKLRKRSWRRDVPKSVHSRRPRRIRDFDDHGNSALLPQAGGARVPAPGGALLPGAIARHEHPADRPYLA